MWKVRGEDNPIPGEKSRMTADSTATEAMTDDEKYKAIIAMESIDPDTAGGYPTKTQFLEALGENRVAGDFKNRVVIVSTDFLDDSSPMKAYGVVALIDSFLCMKLCLRRRNRLFTSFI